MIFFDYPDPPTGGERRTEHRLRWSSVQPKSIYSPWGWGKQIDFQAIHLLLFMGTENQFIFISYFQIRLIK